jgi:2'-5' RNA ligase
MRLFAGLELPGDVKDELAGLIERLRPSAPDAKWVPRDNLHLTLSFLGEVSEDRLAPISGALREAASSVAGPIATRLDGSGAFPTHRRARVVWVGLDDPAGRIARAAAAVAGALEPLGFPKEKRAWTAHLTIARLRTPADVTEVLRTQVPERRFEVAGVTLFRSRLARPSPTYEALERFDLGPDGPSIRSLRSLRSPRQRGSSRPSGT